MTYLVAIVSDCTDANARGRMKQRIKRLVPGADVDFYKVRHHLEAGGNMVDAMDAMAEPPGAVLCNMAPRHADRNGSPIVFKNVLGFEFITTVYALPLFRMFFDEAGCDLRMLNVGAFLESAGERPSRSQFRGLTVIPLLLAHMRGTAKRVVDLDKVSVPFTYPAQEIDPAIWGIDEIGSQQYNAKLTVRRSELRGVSEGDMVRLRIVNRKGKKKDVDATFRECLEDVPVGEIGLITGSSGYGDERFLELVQSGGSVVHACGGLYAGDRIDEIVFTRKEKK
jgi:hypothetical protein